LQPSGGNPLQVGVDGHHPAQGGVVGRALGVGEVKLTGMVTPIVRKVTYEIEVTRLILRRLKMAVSNGIMKADGETVYHVTDMKVGLFQPAT
jgi:3-hydroxyacyl-[acyl-carrier protein] dehydratase/trans-2-decenoyl-[acyl-carrier protein] isomerase